VQRACGRGGYTRVCPHASGWLTPQYFLSKTNSDILEAVRFFTAAAEFKLSAAGPAVRKMLMLIWNKEQSVKDAVIDAYNGLFFGPPEAYTSAGKHKAAMDTATKLVGCAAARTDGRARWRLTRWRRAAAG
jgi:hypothetical protein